jgi:hypothetical protein
MDGPGACTVVLIARLEGRKIDRVLDQFVGGVFKCAGFELTLKRN